MPDADEKFRGDAFLLAACVSENPELLEDQAHLAWFLGRLPGLIGMKSLRDPIVTIAHNNPGLEGYVPIDLSNITASTYIESGRIVLCVHSCQPFDSPVVLDFVRSFFRCKQVRTLLVRETEFR